MLRVLLIDVQKQGAMSCSCKTSVLLSQHETRRRSARGAVGGWDRDCLQRATLSRGQPVGTANRDLMCGWLSLAFGAFSFFFSFVCPFLKSPRLGQGGLVAPPCRIIELFGLLGFHEKRVHAHCGAASSEGRRLQCRIPVQCLRN